MSLTEQLFLPYLAKPARPVITHYDDAAGTRVELSAATLANWAAKTANWLVDEHDVEPADAVCVRLPAHWQTAGVLLGAFWCGAHVVDDDAGARVAFVPPGSVAKGADTVAVVALDPLGRGLPEPPVNAVDYLADARGAGDDFSPLTPVDDGTPALLRSTVAEVAAAARERATALGIGPNDRVLSTVDWTLPAGLVDGLLAPLAAGASLVQVSGADPTKLDARREAERTTVDLLV